MTGNDAAELDDDVFKRATCRGIETPVGHSTAEPMHLFPSGDDTYAEWVHHNRTAGQFNPLTLQEYVRMKARQARDAEVKQLQSGLQDYLDEREADARQRAELRVNLLARADRRPYVALDTDPLPAVNLTYGQARPDWDDYFFEFARLVSTRATCPRASIGVVLVDAARRIVGTGYNGAASGLPHCTEVGCTIFAGHCVRAVHAEINAITSAPRGVYSPDGEFHPWSAEDGVIAYVYGPREICSHCARSLHEAGVKETRCRTN